MNLRPMLERACRSFMTAIENGASLHPMAWLYSRPVGVIATRPVVEPVSPVVLPVEEQLVQIADAEGARLKAGIDSMSQVWERVFNDLGPPPGTDPQPPTIPGMHS